jgi:hypothetical protein
MKVKTKNNKISTTRSHIVSVPPDELNKVTRNAFKLFQVTNADSFKRPIDENKTQNVHEMTSRLVQHLGTNFKKESAKPELLQATSTYK